MSIKTSQAILKCFIDLKSSVWFTPGLACSRLRESGEKSFSKRKCEQRAGAEERAATAPFPKSRSSYFRFARFNTSALYYLRASHRLTKAWRLFPTVFCRGRYDVKRRLSRHALDRKYQRTSKDLKTRDRQKHDIEIPQNRLV